MIQYRISQYIDNEKLISLRDKVLVALSGGADSVALLRILFSLGYTCEAAHCNFHLRGEESDRDEAFVHELCEQLKIKLHIIHFQAAAFASERHVSIEMAARELRYNWFAQLKEENGAAVIAVAHHKDDSAETLLLNLIRGTGLNGLLGIRPRNGDVVRPLLCVNREEILAYLHHIGQDYVTDSTNLQDEYTRNKIRLNLLPLMQEINPSVKDNLIDTCNYLNDVAKIYTKGIGEGRTRVLTEDGINIRALLSEPAPGALLFEIIHPLGFNSAQSKDVLTSLSGQSGKQFSCKGWKLLKDRAYLLIEKEKTTEESIPKFHLEEERIEYTSDFVIPREKSTACFDADKLSEELTVRQWQAGDSFVPFGMTGKKLVSDYLTDRKFSISQKKQQWVLCCGERIAWLIGERVDNRFRIDKATKRIAIYRLL